MKYFCIITSLLFLLSTSPYSFSAANLKKTVAVFEFTNDSGYGSYANLGDDFSMQLSDALIKSGQFIVLTRQDLDVVIAEQDLASSSRFAKSNTAKIGKAIPAQILIKGKITEFEERTSGGGQGLSLYGVSIGSKSASAHVAVIIQIIDTTTGQILDSERVEGKAKSGGLSIGYSGAFSLGSSSFKKTPLGKATQIAIDKAVVYVGQRLSRQPWQGKVVTVKDGTVFINAGTGAGIAEGMKFAVYRQGESLIDPDTGIDLGSENTKIADISVTEAQEKFSKAKILNSSSQIQRSDLVLKE